MTTDLLASGVRDGLGEVKDVDEGRRQVLVTIPTEVIDSYNTDFQRDAFDEYLGQRQPVMCWQHDKKEPIGRVQSWQRMALANEFVSRFSDFDAVPRARQAFTQIRDGDITDFSFYFDQARSIPHPQTRNAIRFTRARMPEISPVTVGSIPGAVATGVRAALDTAGIAELVRARVVTEEEARAMLAGAWGQPLPPLPVRERITAGARSVTITIADDGSVSVGEATEQEPDEPVDPGALAQAVDSVLDQAADLLSGVDTTGWPAEAQQLAALTNAAGVAVDELLDALDVPDPDEGNEDGVTRSAQELAAGLAAAYIAQQTAADEDGGGNRATKEPYGDVDYADPGYQADKQKRYPVDSAEHVKAALAYIGQADNAAKYSPDDLAKVKANVAAAAKKFGIDTGSRSTEDEEHDALDAEAAAALALLNARVVR